MRLIDLFIFVLEVVRKDKITAGMVVLYSHYS